MTRNRIVEENKLPGAPSTEWDVNGWGDPSIQGFGHDISIDLGETIFFKIETDSTDYRIDIYRIGWYGGLGARLVDTVAPSVPLPQSQPEGLRDPATRLYDSGNWAVSASWTAPKDAVSGIYFARLVRQDPEPEPAAWRADHSLTPPDLAPRRGTRGVALRMEARRVGHPDDSVPGGRRQRQPRSARRGRHRHRVRGGVRDRVRYVLAREGTTKS